MHGAAEPVVIEAFVSDRGALRVSPTMLVFGGQKPSPRRDAQVEILHEDSKALPGVRIEGDRAFVVGGWSAPGAPAADVRSAMIADDRLARLVGGCDIVETGCETIAQHCAAETHPCTPFLSTCTTCSTDSTEEQCAFWGYCPGFPSWTLADERRQRVFRA